MQRPVAARPPAMTTKGGVIEEPGTGLQFPCSQQFWNGSNLSCLGAGPRVKKVAFIPVKAYAVAMYVDEGAATQAERQERQPESERAALDVLKHGAFTKVLLIRLVHGVTGKQFVDALDENLRPLMRGDEAVLNQFGSFFLQGKKLEKGTEVAMLWRAEGPLDVCVRPPSDTMPYTSARPGLTVASPRLGHALWELYLSADAPSPDARNAWLAAVQNLVAQAPER